MAILAGIDEAGLGPRLGPLVVGLAVFRGPRGVLDRLADALAPEVRADGRAPVPVGDSKRLYAAARGLHVLERGIYPFVRLATGVLPRSLAEWLGRLELARPDTPPFAAPLPWYAAPLELPRAVSPDRLEEGADRLGAALARAGVEASEVRTVVVAEDEVNRALARCGSKNVLNFEAAAPLLRRMFEVAAGDADEDMEIVVDRQGGRKDYAALLGRLFHPAVVHCRPAPEGVSAYTVRTAARHAEIRFATRADAAFLPVSLASMLAKYTRELHMTLLNRFWQARLPDLKPTAGYPTDAGRFLDRIDACRRAAGIPVDRLVRNR
ncbi:MAG: hypothetical protein JXQ29_13215 [Planctomycetes bacterium]|nr:hypothetical protein [Planctomycetota bacterium]